MADWTRLNRQLDRWWRERRAMAGGVVPMLVVLAALLGIGYLMLDRIQAVNDRLDAFGRRMEQIAADAGAAREAAETARSAARNAEALASEAAETAVQAEQSAVEAARTRAAAEQARLEAEAEAADAQVVAEQAQIVAEEAQQEAAQVQAEMERVQREREAELARLEEALSDVVETRRTALGLVMNLGSDAIEFEFDRAALDSQDRELLSRIAGILLTSQGYYVNVYGHTDDVGSAEYNQELSERRARAVRDYLVEAGVPSGIITTRGYGKSSPRVEDTSPEARAKNRRVEIAIIDVNIGQAREIAN